MSKTFATLAVAVGLAFTGAPAGATTASNAQIVTVSPAKMAVARRTVEIGVAANERIVELTRVLNDPRVRNASTPEELVAAIEAMTTQIDASRAELRQLRAQLDALPPVAEEGDPQQLKAIDVMVVDLSVSVGRMDDLLGAFVALGTALKTGDAAAADRAAKALSESMMLTLDSQALMLRARVALSDPDTVVYAQTIALACFYESFAAVTRGELDFAPRGEAVAKSRAALACARTQMAAGRQALARDAERPAPNAQIRAMQIRLADVNGRMFDEMVRAEAGLASATTVLEAGGDFDAIERELDVFQAAELALSQLANEQMQAATDSDR